MALATAMARCEKEMSNRPENSKFCASSRGKKVFVVGITIFVVIAAIVAVTLVPLLGENENKLKFIGENPEVLLARCEGDCDTDADCSLELVCFFRERGGSVPGCGGDLATEVTYKATDYCIPSADISSAAPSAVLPDVPSFGQSAGTPNDPTAGLSPSTTLATCNATECVKRCFAKMNECTFQDNQDTDLWSKCSKTLYCAVKGCGAAQTVWNGGQDNQENQLVYPIGKGNCKLDAGTGTDYSELHCEGAFLSEEQRGSCRTGVEYFQQLPAAGSYYRPCSALECVKRCFTKMNECTFQDNLDTDLWSKCIKTLFCAVKGCGASETIFNGGRYNQENRLNYPIGEGYCLLDAGTDHSELYCEGAILSEERRGWCRTGAEYFEQFSA